MMGVVSSMAMKNAHKIVLAVVVTLLVAFAYASCVATEDFHQGAQVQDQLRVDKETIAIDVASGAITAEEGAKRLEDAYKRYFDAMKEIGETIEDRTKAGFDWQAILSQLLLSTVTGVITYKTTNARRDSMRVKRGEPVKVTVKPHG